MPSQPLVIILLLFFLMLVMAALAVWFALTTNWRSQAEVEPKKRQEQKKARPEKPATEVSNDNFRGARASRKREKDDSGDPFDRFIRSKNDDLEF